MIELRPATENEVVLAFLRADIGSPKPDVQQLYAGCLHVLGLDRATLMDGDLADEHANRARKAVLGCARGFGRGEALFQGFPFDTAWRRVKVEAPDFDRLKCIGSDSQWRKLTNGTRLIREAARNLDADPDIARIVRGIMQAVQSDDPPLDELIMVEINDALVLVEGTKRATAYAALGDQPFDAFLGTSPTMGGWVFGRDQ